MKVTEHVSLAPYTTFHIGGPARFLVEIKDDAEVEEALSFARDKSLPFRVLGAGSNILVPDTGVNAVVARLSGRNVSVSETSDLLVADAGARWDAVVDAAAELGLWGVENLAGIPGTAGGAVVQNIGAYGAALSDTLAYVDTINAHTGVQQRYTRQECALQYRDSMFRNRKELIITRVALDLSPDRINGANRSYHDPNKNYKSLDGLLAGNDDPTPVDVAKAIRAIRADKFPDLSQEGTAGSFFGNPILSEPEARALQVRFPGMPLFSLPETEGVKVPAGWLLDHVLHARGLTHGKARVYEKHALVIVAMRGANAIEVDALAREIQERVFDVTGITLEREVEMFGA